MMTDQELGELVVKIQADDIRPRDLRAFLEAVINDKELRRNLKLAGQIANLEKDVRENNCAANILFLLTYSTLAPLEKPEEKPTTATTRAFAETFQVGTITGWKDHVEKAVAASTRETSSKPNKPDLKISKELHTIVVALEEFWDCRGKYVKT